MRKLILAVTVGITIGYALAQRQAAAERAELAEFRRRWADPFYDDSAEKKAADAQQEREVNAQVWEMKALGKWED